MPGLTISSANQEGVMTAEQLADRRKAGARSIAINTRRISSARLFFSRRMTAIS
jgi:hypothetical protein